MSPDSVTTARRAPAHRQPGLQRGRATSTAPRRPSPRRSAARTAGSSSTTGRSDDTLEIARRWERELRLRDSAQRAEHESDDGPRSPGPGAARLGPSTSACRQRAGASSPTSASSTATSSCRRSGSRRCSSASAPSPSSGLAGRAPERALAATAGRSSRFPIQPHPRRGQALPPRVPGGHRRHHRAPGMGHHRRDLRADARLRHPQPARARRPPPPPLGLGRRPPARARAPRRVRVDPAPEPCRGRCCARSSSRAFRPRGSPAPPSSMATRAPPASHARSVDDPQFRRFVRRELRERMRGPLGAALRDAPWVMSDARSTARGSHLREAAVHGVRWAAMARGTVEVVLMASMVALARLIPPAEFGHFAVAIIVQELAIVHHRRGCRQRPRPARRRSTASTSRPASGSR